jgi:hypothetical protein
MSEVTPCGAECLPPPPATQANIPSPACPVSPDLFRGVESASWASIARPSAPVAGRAGSPPTYPATHAHSRWHGPVASASTASLSYAGHHGLPAANVLAGRVGVQPAAEQALQGRQQRQLAALAQLRAEQQAWCEAAAALLSAGRDRRDLGAPMPAAISMAQPPRHLLEPLSLDGSARAFHTSPTAHWGVPRLGSQA